MASTFVAYASNLPSGGHTGVEPTGSASGDVEIAICWTDLTTAHTGPAGWSQIGTQLNDAVGGRVSMWQIVRGGSAPALTWGGPATGDYIEIAIVSYRGAANSGTIIDASDRQTQTSATAPQSPTLTTTIDNDMLICFLVDSEGSISVETQPSGMTSRHLNAADGSTGFAELALGAHGVTGAKTWTTTSAGTNTIAGSIALAPFVAATGTSDTQAPGRVQRQLISHWRRQ